MTKLVVCEGYEQDRNERFTHAQREWVRMRDIVPHSPVIDDYGNLVDLDIEKKGEVHHINMIDHVKRITPGVNPNSPLNAFYIGHGFHLAVHRDWILPLREEWLAYSPYMNFETYVKLETWTGKRAYWLSAYDDVLNSMAIVNSYELLKEEVDFPFKEEHRVAVNSLYPYVSDTFKQQYQELKSFYNICP